MHTSTLGAVLRAWRDRTAPPQPARGRRTPGLRREELAALAGVSVDYVVRLEQGRAAHPSPQVVASLARALRLTRAERSHLHQLAGLVEATAERVPDTVPPSITRLVERMQGTPVSVFSPAWDLLSCNPAWESLLGPQSTFVGRRRNLVWRLFTEPENFVLRSAAEHAAFSTVMVSDLRGAAGRYPRDVQLQGLIGELQNRSPTFAQLWAHARIEPHRSQRKTLLSKVGTLTLDCDVLTTDGDLRMVVYTAAPGSESEALLSRLVQGGRAR